MKPGVYDMSQEEYQKLDALSGSGIHTLMSRCPLVFWHRSPMNPRYQPENKIEFDVGIAAHLACLEPDELQARVVVVDAPDWRTKDARDRREAAWEEGKVPMLPHQYAQVLAMARAINLHPLASKAFRGGEAEKTFVWKHPRYGFLCKARPDYVHPQRMVNLKTTASAKPDDFRRTAYQLGYHVSAWWHMEGARRVLGSAPADYWFLVVERDAPHPVTIARFAERAMAWAELQAEAGAALYAKCRAEGRWPDYGDKAVEIELPDWAEYQLQDRHDRGEFAPAYEAALREA